MKCLLNQETLLPLLLTRTTKQSIKMRLQEKNEFNKVQLCLKTTMILSSSLKHRFKKRKILVTLPTSLSSTVSFSFGC